MSRQLAGCAAAAAALIALAWLATSGGSARIGAHLRTISAPPPGTEAPLKTGISPATWRPSWAGPGGRLATRHPRSSSPNLTAVQRSGYDWMFCPPSEGDL